MNDALGAFWARSQKRKQLAVLTAIEWARLDGLLAELQPA